MLLTHPTAHKKSLFGDSNHHEWRFVILGHNSPWIHLTQTILKKGKAVESKTLIISEPSELHNMHVNINADVCYEEAYLITPPHINQTRICNQSLLKQVDRVVEHSKNQINVYHIYTVDNGKKFLSSAPLAQPDSRNITNLYKAPVEVSHRASEREIACMTRRLEIFRAAAVLHDGNPEFVFSWMFESLHNLEGQRPIEMTSDKQFEQISAYISSLTINKTKHIS